MYFKEFTLPQNPKIPEYCVNIKEFGATEGKEQLCTAAIEAAIQDCAVRGGGKVVFPSGTWLTGAIHLKSNIELHFEDGCRVLFSPEKSLYLPVVYTSFEGIRCYNYSPLIYGYRLNNIAITGKGILDGNGAQWWQWKTNEYGINSIYTACANDLPVEKRIYGSEKLGLRPCFIQFAECEDVLIEGVTLCNSPFWTVHPIWCNRVNVRGLTLTSPFDSPNTDSINVESCDTVLVENCSIQGGGDDIFTLKAGRGTDGWNVGKPCRNVIIRNCRASDTNGGGIVIGSEMSGGVENILAHDCVFNNIMNGIKIKSKKGRGGYVRNIEYKNIEANNVSFGINFTLKYAYDDRFSGNDLEAMPDITNISVDGFQCEKAKNSVLVQGVADCSIKNVQLKNITIKGATGAMTSEYTENLCIENTSLI